MNENISVNSIPIEIFTEILIKIDGRSLARCRRVCKQWKEAIDDSHIIWQEICFREFKNSSKIAKRKSGEQMNWYHIYRNLKLWSNVSSYEKTLKEFYKFNLHATSHMLDINYGVLPLKDAKGTFFYDVANLKYIPVALSGIDCLKVSNSDSVTVVQIKSGIFVQRTVSDQTDTTESFFKADNFVLYGDLLYFHNNRDVYKCNLLSKDLTPKLLVHCAYDIKELLFNGDIVYLFTDCGKIINIHKDNFVGERQINCPVDWIKHIKKISAVDDKNFICYSRNLFKIETDHYQHLYLDFPPITALFFYIDVVLIGLRNGSILLYRLSNQKKATSPIFETLAELPDGKFPVQLDVYERRSGPMIAAATFFELYLIDITFSQNEQAVKNTYTSNKLHMYKRLQRVKERLQTP